LVVGGEFIEITSIEVLCETLGLIPGGLSRTNTENFLEVALPGNTAAFPTILDCLESLGLVFS
jgi:hypothetical protein